MAQQKRVVVGIDGGGTKTRALLVGFDGVILAEATGGASNIQKKGVPEAAELFFDLVQKCAEKAEAPHSAIAHVVVGAAGAGRPSTRSELSAAISALAQKNKFPLSQVTVETDARIALEAAFPGKPVIALIGGTGSIALYRADDLRIHRAGGWGSIIGDEGSGYAIARDACAAVMRHYDGRSEKTLLTEKLLAHFDLREVEDLIPKIHAEKTEIAPFAEKVCQAVAERDRVARQILLKHAAELVEHVRILALAHPPKNKLPVCLMGGLLENENEYSKLVREKLVATLPQIVVQKPKFPAAFGAAILGMNAFR
ncbi:MAG TPA: BadF/BadG/BcrA/BcrD ATPase family protein [Bacteroidota bacterium]|nr:BadF/BadG/BcrA/BcrD ATPase family protein [Bacteroidota bacterium]